MKIQSRITARGGNPAGFTLVELMLVLVILATLAAIVLPRLAGRSEQARETAAKTQINVFEQALDAFEVDNGYYPDTSAGLFPLMEQPQNATNWHGPYLQKGVPKDPWGSDYVYEYPGKVNPTGYDIYSLGPDQRANTQDDITNMDAGETSSK